MRDKRLATAVATLLAAFATAHLMQFGLSAGQLAATGGQAAPIGLATLVARQVEEGGSPPPAGTPAPSSPSARLLPADAGPPPPVAAGAVAAAEPSCERRIVARPGPRAVLLVEVLAPCDPGARVEIAHDGLRFALATGPDGRARAEIPAMRPDATVEARFADGPVLRAHAAIPDAAHIVRIAVVAEGWTGLTLHASGRGAPGLRTGATVRLGDPRLDAPLLAEVHTMPSGRFGPLGDVNLTLEASVTPANCARDVTAEILRSGDRSAPTRLRLAMPSCDAVGGMLVLDLPPADLRLAGRRP